MDKKGLATRIVCLILAGLMGIMGAISWQGPVSLLVISGIIINTVAIASPNPQFVRKSILISSPLVLLYNVFVFSLGGIVYESIVIISSVIGIIRYKNNK